MKTCSIKAMAILILCQRKMKRQTTTRKRMPTTEVNASQVFFCFKKSSMISGVQFNCRNQSQNQSKQFLRGKHLEDVFVRLWVIGRPDVVEIV